MDVSNANLPTCYKMVCVDQTVLTQVVIFIMEYVLNAILHVPRVQVAGPIIAYSVRICTT